MVEGEGGKKKAGWREGKKRSGRCFCCLADHDHSSRSASSDLNFCNQSGVYVHPTSVHSNQPKQCVKSLGLLSSHPQDSHQQTSPLINFWKVEGNGIRSRRPSILRNPEQTPPLRPRPDVTLTPTIPNIRHCFFQQFLQVFN